MIISDIESLTDAELNRAVAKAQGWFVIYDIWATGNEHDDIVAVDEYHPTSNWQQAGELLEKYQVYLEPYLPTSGKMEWHAMAQEYSGYMLGDDNPRRAICLAVVAMKLQEHSDPFINVCDICKARIARSI